MGFNELWKQIIWPSLKNFLFPYGTFFCWFISQGVWQSLPNAANQRNQRIRAPRASPYIPIYRAIRQPLPNKSDGPGPTCLLKVSSARGLNRTTTTLNASLRLTVPTTKGSGDVAGGINGDSLTRFSCLRPGPGQKCGAVSSRVIDKFLMSIWTAGIVLVTPRPAAVPARSSDGALPRMLNGDHRKRKCWHRAGRR